MPDTVDLRGSSPLARGLPGRRSSLLPCSRIIPARAGFTPTRPTSASSPGDHPRSRGVYPVDWLSADGAWGSSPLARGLLHGAELPGRLIRIIPARAGFTPGPCRWTPACPDHPRSRGVYRSATQCFLLSPGSSPLARGLHQRVPVRAGGPGIIPARAGFTTGRRRSSRPRTDHPRSRGVYSPDREYGEKAIGSSPLARGLLDDVLKVFVSDRIIPARAGFTWSVPAEIVHMTDHPRSRGVYSWWCY